MKKFVRSVPAMLLISAATLSLIALVGCGGSSRGGNNSGGSPGGGNNPGTPAAAQNIYAIQKRVESGPTNQNAQDSILVFSASATGTTTPTSTLNLPLSFYAQCVAVGPQGQIYVGGGPAGTGLGQILEYAAGSTGSVTPTVTLNGSTTSGTTFNYPDELAVNSAGTLVVSSEDRTVETFASGFTSSSAPTQYLTWGTLNAPLGGYNFVIGGGYIGLDTAGDIFYEDNQRQVISVFAAGATGATAPVRQITGTDTTYFSDLGAIAVDGAGDVYVANVNAPVDYGQYEPTDIIEFAAGAMGNATPSNRIGGSATNINEPDRLAVDAVGNLYYADANGGDSNNSDEWNNPVILEIFAAGAAGNVAPTASMTSSSFTFANRSGGAPMAIH